MRNSKIFSIRTCRYRCRSKWGSICHGGHKIPWLWQFDGPPDSSIPRSTTGKMFTDSTNLDVDSTDYGRCIQTELDPLIQRNEKGPTKKELRIARAQFLALCWVLFVIGWIDGSTGPLLPRFQNFYDVSWRFPLIIFQPLMNSADRIRNCVLGIYVTVHGQ